MKKLEKLCVFCGASSGNTPIYTQAASYLGCILAQHDVELIYGAGGTGVMGAVAESTKKAGGKITGMTIDRLFERERPDLVEINIDTLKVFNHMFTRKIAMTKLADAFCVLPGGFGTMDELFELLVLKQLGIIDKPIVILNINYFYDSLQAMIHQFFRDGFSAQKNNNLLCFVDKVEDIIPTIEQELKEK